MENAFPRASCKNKHKGVSENYLLPCLTIPSFLVQKNGNVKKNYLYVKTWLFFFSLVIVDILCADLAQFLESYTGMQYVFFSFLFFLCLLSACVYQDRDLKHQLVSKKMTSGNSELYHTTNAIGRGKLWNCMCDCSASGDPVNVSFVPLFIWLNKEKTKTKIETHLTNLTKTFSLNSWWSVFHLSSARFPPLCGEKKLISILVTEP